MARRTRGRRSYNSPAERVDWPGGEGHARERQAKPFFFKIWSSRFPFPSFLFLDPAAATTAAAGAVAVVCGGIVCPVSKSYGFYSKAFLFWSKGVGLCAGPNKSFSMIVEHHVAKFWMWVAQPLLFGIVGTAVDFRKIKAATIPRSIVVILSGTPAPFLETRPCSSRAYHVLITAHWSLLDRAEREPIRLD